MNSLTIVIPTRDNPAICRKAMDCLLEQSASHDLSLRVVFLVNDTRPETFCLLEQAAEDERFRRLHPLLLQASQNWPTVEENVRHTLGERLDVVDEYFLIVGNSDIVNLDVLTSAYRYMQEHRLDLLLVGVLNRETYQERPVRQLYTTPRHLNPKNHLSANACHGKDTFADVMADYGPVDYLGFIGCQIYTKSFFRNMCAVQEELQEPLYSIPLATLELTTRQLCRVGFWPEIVVVRVDHLQGGPDSPEHAADWWIVKQRTDRDLSDHLLLSVLTGSLRLSDSAFALMVNAQTVSIPRARPQYVFSNLLFNLVQQISSYVHHGLIHPVMRYRARELQEIVCFGKRLASVNTGLPAAQQDLISRWLQQFALVNYDEPRQIEELLTPAQTVLDLLDRRPGMERWIAQLN